MKTSFRKFVTQEIRSQRPVWSEMAVGTRFNKNQGGLPTTQGMMNVISLAGKTDADRVRLLRWLTNEGLYKAVKARNAITAELINKIEKDNTLNTGNNLFDIGGDRKIAVGESVRYLEGRRNTDDPPPPSIYKYQDDPVNPLDVFNPTMREKNLSQYTDWIDEQWEKRFYRNFTIPIFRNGKIEGSILLRKLNKLLSSKGYETFRYGTDDGYLQYVEKGDWLPEEIRMHWGDEAQRHGPDLSATDVEEDEDGNVDYHFDNIGTPKETTALMKKLKRMSFDFTDLASKIKAGEDAPDHLKNIADKIKSGKFKDIQWVPERGKDEKRYAKEKLGLTRGMSASDSFFPKEVVEEVKDIVNQELPNAEFKLKNIRNTIDNYDAEDIQKLITVTGDHTFKISKEVQDYLKNFIFENIDLENLESKEEWKINSRVTWKSVFKKIFSDSGITPGKKTLDWINSLGAGQDFNLVSFISEAVKRNPRLMSKATKYYLKSGEIASKFGQKNKQTGREFTEKGLSDLVKKGYKINGKDIPNDLETIQGLIDDNSNDQLLARKGDHLVKLVSKDGKYYAVFSEPNEDDPYDMGDPESHLAAGPQLPISLDRRQGVYPLSSKEEQEEFENELIQGEYGPEGEGSDGHGPKSAIELESLKSAVGAAKSQYIGKTMGNVEDPNGKKVNVIGKEEDVDDLFGGKFGLLKMGEEALKAYGGHYAMRWGFITNEQYLAHTKFDTEEELESEGGRTFEARFENVLIELGIEANDSVTKDVLKRVFNSIKRGDGPKEEDFQDYIEKYGEKFWHAVRGTLMENAKAARTRLIKNYVFQKMKKMKSAQINQRGFSALNLDTQEDGEGRANDRLGGGKKVSYANIDPLAGREYILDDQNFSMLKSSDFKINGNKEMPDSFEELANLIDKKSPKSIRVSTVKSVEDDPLIQNVISTLDEKDKERILSQGKIKLALYLFKGTKEKEDVAIGDDNRTEDAYLMSGTPPDQVGTGSSKRSQVAIDTGFSDPEAFGPVSDIDLDKKTSTQKPQKPQPTAEPVSQQPEPQPQPEPTAGPVSQEPQQQPTAGPLAQEPQQKYKLRLPPNMRENKPKYKLRLPPNMIENNWSLPSYKIWKETDAVYDPNVKVKDGAGFNWWGAVGKSGGTSIEGEVKTAKTDPDGTKNKKKKKKK